MEKLEPNLLNTLNSKNVQAKLTLDEYFNTVAKPTGYFFFEYEGCVYHLTDDGSYKYTGFSFNMLTVTQDDVLEYVASLSYWGAVNQLIYEVRLNATDRLGSDYSQPQYDE